VLDVLCAYLRLPYSADPSEGQLATITSERCGPIQADGAAQDKEQRTPSIDVHGDRQRQTTDESSDAAAPGFDCRR
jgi:hypothetical protein